MKKQVRVRFAPSPTGYLHVGGARTALYNFLFAKKNEGTFVLRIEDTDEERSTEEAMRMQISDLHWLGLRWDEGPDPVTLKDRGDYGPYRQSERKSIYKEYAEKLISSGVAYYCFLTDAEIAEQKKIAEATGKPPHVKSPYRDWTVAQAKEKMASGAVPVVRFKVPEVHDIVLEDLVRGKIVFPSDMVGDFVLIRSSGMPVYNFCCVIDDALMKITHVLRAEEHLSNTPRQLMIYKALGFEAPQFGHLSIILGSDRQKLSKRHGATSCNEFRLRGYLAEALNNFIALLGWSSPDGKEILSMPEMIQQFSLDRLHSAPAVFDEQKFLWMNSMHLRALDNASLWKELKPFLDEAGLKLPEDSEWQNRVLQLFKSNLETFKDSVSLFSPLTLGALELHEEAKEVMTWEQTKVVVGFWKEALAAHPTEFLSTEEFEKIQERIKSEKQIKGKHLFMPIRVAVIGRPHGAELKELVPLISKTVLIQRAEVVLKLL